MILHSPWARHHRPLPTSWLYLPQIIPAVRRGRQLGPRAWTGFLAVPAPREASKCLSAAQQMASLESRPTRLAPRETQEEGGPSGAPRVCAPASTHRMPAADLPLSGAVHLGDLDLCQTREFLLRELLPGGSQVLAVAAPRERTGTALLRSPVQSCTHMALPSCSRRRPGAVTSFPLCVCSLHHLPPPARRSKLIPSPFPGLLREASKVWVLSPLSSGEQSSLASECTVSRRGRTGEETETS